MCVCVCVCVCVLAEMATYVKRKDSCFFRRAVLNRMVIFTTDCEKDQGGYSGKRVSMLGIKTSNSKKQRQQWRRGAILSKGKAQAAYGKLEPRAVLSSHARQANAGLGIAMRGQQAGSPRRRCASCDTFRTSPRTSERPERRA